MHTQALPSRAPGKPIDPSHVTPVERGYPKTLNLSLRSQRFSAFTFAGPLQAQLIRHERSRKHDIKSLARQLEAMYAHIEAMEHDDDARDAAVDARFAQDGEAARTLAERFDELRREAANTAASQGAAIAALTAEVTGLRAHAEASAAAQERLSAAQREAALAHTEIGVLRAEVNGLQEGLRAADARCTQLTADAEALRSSLHELTSRHDSLRAEHREAIETLANALDEERRTRDDALAKLDGAAATLSSHGQRVRVLEQASAATAADVRERMGTIRTELDAVRQTMDGWGVAFAAAGAADYREEAAAIDGGAWTAAAGASGGGGYETCGFVARCSLKPHAAPVAAMSGGGRGECHLPPHPPTATPAMPPPLESRDGARGGDRGACSGPQLTHATHAPVHTHAQRVRAVWAAAESPRERVGSPACFPAADREHACFPAADREHGALATSGCTTPRAAPATAVRGDAGGQDDGQLRPIRRLADAWMAATSPYDARMRALLASGGGEAQAASSVPASPYPLVTPHSPPLTASALTPSQRSADAHTHRLLLSGLD